MTDKITNLPLTYEVQTYENKIQLPSVEEIKQNGLSAELKEQLLNLNSKFEGDLIVFPYHDNYVDELTMVVVRSDLIMRRFRQNYPNVAILLDHNRRNTVAFLKANGALTTAKVKGEFSVSHSGINDGVKVWSQYKEKIYDFANDLCEKLGKEINDHLYYAKQRLSTHIHDRYYEKFPLWPSVGNTNEGEINLNDHDAYISGAFSVIWSCFGEVKVIDERPSSSVYKAYFSGSPDIKAVVLNSDKLNEMEEDFKKRGIEGSKRFIDQRSIEDYGNRGLLEWKYI